MLLAIILILLGILVAYLLLMPIIVSIDTKKNEYYLQLKGLAKAYILPNEETLIRIQLNVLFMTFNIDPLDEYYKRKQSKKLKKSNQKPKKENRHRKIEIIKIIRLLKTFKVKEFYINLDTGSVITNAKLFPVFQCLNYYKGGFHINFLGHNQLALKLQNRPINIIKTFINS